MGLVGRGRTERVDREVKALLGEPFLFALLRIIARSLDDYRVDDEDGLERVLARIGETVSSSTTTLDDGSSSYAVVVRIARRAAVRGRVPQVQVEGLIAR